jgi:hypothetical protein
VGNPGRGGQHIVNVGLAGASGVEPFGHRGEGWGLI